MDRTILSKHRTTIQWLWILKITKFSYFMQLKKISKNGGSDKHIHVSINLIFIFVSFYYVEQK